MDSARLFAAIGASAGGIEPLRALLHAAIPGSGVSYIVQMHLDPDRESSLAEILARDCALPVETAQDGQTILPMPVLVIPPGVTAAMQEDSWLVYTIEPDDELKSVNHVCHGCVSKTHNHD